MKTSSSFGQWLRRQRRGMDLTQIELARRTGCAQVTIKKLEADQLRPSRQLAEAVIRQLGVEPQRVEAYVRFARGGSDPKLFSLTFPRNNLPADLTSFIGREKEIAEISRAIKKYRLVTLTGSGGIGKTRLSLKVAADLVDEFPEGLWFIELSPLTKGDLIQQVIISTVGVYVNQNKPPLQALCDYLRGKSILLVLDNCEHLVDDCAKFAEIILRAAPNLKILATSREMLGVPGEVAWRVPSLSLPDIPSLPDIEQLLHYEAIQLFIERARLVQPNFIVTNSNTPTIARICHQLDGIPLAIELAAAQIKMMSLEQINDHLHDRFDSLTNGSRTVLPRHKTLRAAMDWSYNLLSEPEKVLLHRLAVFSGGWTLSLAEQVCSDEKLVRYGIFTLMGRLLDTSLISSREIDPGERYYFLEILRQYALEKLIASGEADRLRNKHLISMLELAQRAEPYLYGKGQLEWMHKLEDEYENMQIALEWSLQANASVGQELAGALWWSWNLSGRLREGYEWLKKMLATCSNDETLIRAKLLCGAGWLAGLLGYSEQGKKYMEESLALCQRLGNEPGMAFPLSALGVHAFQQSDYEEAVRLANESQELFKRAGDQWGIRHALGIVGYTAEAKGDFEKAQKCFDESLSICKRIGDLEGVGWTLFLMGELAISKGEYTKANALLEEALQTETIANVAKGPVPVWILEEMGSVFIFQGDYEKGKLVLEQAIDICRWMGDQNEEANLLQLLGWASRLQRDYSSAQLLYSESLQLLQKTQQIRNSAECLVHIGLLMGAQGSPEVFAHALGIAEGAIPYIRKKLGPFISMETDQCITMARARLGDAGFDAAWEAGRQMNLEQGFVYALDVLQQCSIPSRSN